MSETAPNPNRVHRRKLRNSERPARPKGHRSAPPLVRIDPEPGVTPSKRPPVRIFLGTEPRQYRAERVFVWSVRKHRDPARTYEIHLMKDLEGYDRYRWTTGFTNFRFVIPHLAGRHGKAIYNDVDQIYLADPAELFDRDLGGKGILAITESETSVLLIDCEKMSRIWSVEDAKRIAKKVHYWDPVKQAGLWGSIPMTWNSRDLEYVEGQSKLLHYTELGAQPWRPFPEAYKYRVHEHGEVWHALEREADAAGFTMWTRESPSDAFRALVQRGDEHGAGPALPEPATRHHVEKVKALVARHEPGKILDVGGGLTATGAAIPAETVPLFAPDGTVLPLPAQPTGAVVAIDRLERFPEEDIPWVLREMFRAAKGFVYVGVSAYRGADRRPVAGHPHRAPLPPEWWRGQVEIAARGFPGVEWALEMKARKPGPFPVAALFGTTEWLSAAA